MTMTATAKSNVTTILNGAVSLGDKFRNAFLYPIVFMVAVVVVVGILRLNAGESLIIFGPLMLPTMILGIAYWIIQGVVGIKDNVSEIAEAMATIKELKSIEMKDPAQSKLKFKANASNLVKFIAAIGGAAALKDAPSMVKDAFSAVKSLTMLANPISLLLILFGIVTMWMYSGFLLLNAIF